MARKKKGRPKSTKKQGGSQPAGSNAVEKAPAPPPPKPEPEPVPAPPAEVLPLYARENVGSVLTILGLIGFFFLCALLPLVGQAGAQTSHYGANFMTFLAALLIALALALLGLMSKLRRRKVDNSPFPMVSAGLTGFYLVLFLCLVTGLLGI